MTPRPRGPVRGVLMVLAGLMLVSGVIRVGLGVSLAQAVPAPEPPALDHSRDPCGTTPKALAEALRQREERLITQEAAIAGRLAALALADKALETRLAQLEAAEATLSATLARADGAAEDDVSRLTSVYESMKPKDAAALFTAMAPDFAAGFLSRMRPEAAAAVLSGMGPDSAYAVSVLMAGRNARAPTE